MHRVLMASLGAAVVCGAAQPAIAQSNQVIQFPSYSLSGWDPIPPPDECCDGFAPKVTYTTGDTLLMSWLDVTGASSVTIRVELNWAFSNADGTTQVYLNNVDIGPGMLGPTSPLCNSTILLTTQQDFPGPNGAALPYQANATNTLGIRYTGPGFFCIGVTDNAVPWTVQVTVTPTEGPQVPSGLAQYRSDGTTTIPVGGSTEESQVILEGTVSDLGEVDCQLMVEVRPVTSPLTGQATHQSATVVSGSTVQVSVDSLSLDNYHWQAWTQNANGTPSSAVEFGNNPTFNADFIVSNTPPPPPPPGGSAAPLDNPDHAAGDAKKFCGFGAGPAAGGGILFALLIAAHLAGQRRRRIS